MSERDLREERTCPWVKECWCPHTDCYAGFLTNDQIRAHNGKFYVETVRCPACLEGKVRADEAREMEPEVAAHRRKRGR